MKYLSGASGNEANARMLADAGIGLMCQVGNSLHKRIDWFPFWATDIGMAFNADTDRYLDYLDRLPRSGHLFVVSPDAYPDPVESQRRRPGVRPDHPRDGFQGCRRRPDGCREAALALG